MSPFRTAQLTLISVSCLVLVCARVHRDLPDLRELDAYRPPLRTLVLDRSGREIGEFFEQRRTMVSLEEVPAYVVDAFLASEDARFFRHAGVDPTALVRAAWVNVRAGGKVRQGGSTITQQLVKTLFLEPKRTLGRKLQDMLLALLIELRLPKERILEAYLNQIYFGNGAWGVGAAAHVYFGKQVADLSISEAALLAGLPRAPSANSPLANPRAAEERRRSVLDRMLDLRHIDEYLWRGAVAERPRIRPAGPSEAYASSAYFVEEVRQALFERFGADAVLRGGLRVETTLDLDLQLEATRALRAGLETVDGRQRRKGSAGPRPDVEGALLALEVASGDVLALVGGYDFARSPFDRATQAHRQPGSAFKTFVYGAALEAGFPPQATVYDYQVEFRLPKKKALWRPRNYEKELLGPVPMSEAFARSLNNATIRLLDDVGVRPVMDFARRAGIESPLAGDLGLALGTSEVTLLEITRAYATFAAGGRPPRPRFVRRVLDRDGLVLAEDLPVVRIADAPGIAPVDAYLVTHLLRETVSSSYGTGRSASSVGRPLAGKTGSTNENRDAWFIGFSPEIAAGVWVGRDTRDPIGRAETGARAALPIWSQFMRAALAKRPAGKFPQPRGLVFASIDPWTGERLESRSQVAGYAPWAAGRRTRSATYVPPPEAPEPAPTELVLPLMLPAVGAGPPRGEP